MLLDRMVGRGAYWCTSKLPDIGGAGVEFLPHGIGRDRAIAARGSLLFYSRDVWHAGWQVAGRQKRVTRSARSYDATLIVMRQGAVQGWLVYSRWRARRLCGAGSGGDVEVGDGSYARRGAGRSLIPLCKVGPHERPERLVLLISADVRSQGPGLCSSRWCQRSLISPLCITCQEREAVSAAEYGLSL